MNLMEECISCGKKDFNGISFPCPKCKTKLTRCQKCRDLSIDYTCPKCGFVGP
jgi:predicted RNA-binding Zn-ribbon protein involved in translation (DUF1610 family)